MTDIIAIDPGKSTGFATWYGGVFRSRIFEYPEVMEEIVSFVPAFDVVVCETFVITARTVKLSRQYWSLELIGLIKWLCWRDGIELVMQSPSDAMSFATTTKLKELGWYNTGAGHDNDAARHLLTYLAKREVETFKTLWRDHHQG